MGKRVIDVVGAAVFLILALPVILTTAVILAFLLRTWPFFVQERIGFGNRPLRFLKLRTLPRAIPAYASKHNFGEVVVPPFCRFLRATHLDELPQLLLVLTGRLSLVGPRPKMPDHAEPADPHHAAVRTTVAQGCTGLWQISVDQHLQVSEAPAYDLFYVANRTVWLDLWILWRTFAGLMKLRGPVTIDEVPSWTLRTTTPRSTRSAAEPVADMVLVGGG